MTEEGSGEHGAEGLAGVNGHRKGGAGAISTRSPLKDGLKRMPKASGPSDDDYIDVEAGIAVYCDNGAGKRTHAILRVSSASSHDLALAPRRSSRICALLGVAPVHKLGVFTRTPHRFEQRC